MSKVAPVAILHRPFGLGPYIETLRAAWDSNAAESRWDDMLAALRLAKRLTDNINEFGACTDSEIYDAAWQAIEAAITKATAPAA